MSFLHCLILLQAVVVGIAIPWADFLISSSFEVLSRYEDMRFVNVWFVGIFDI